MFAAENGLRGDPRLKAISDSISVVPNFPKPGIMFQDITTLVSNHKAFKHTVDIFVDRYKDMGISVVAGVEARGFIFAPPIALAIGAKFIPLRKPGKLPGEVISESYELEYGHDCLQMHVGALVKGERALVIDDLVATGGTLSAAIKLLATSIHPSTHSISSSIVATSTTKALLVKASASPSSSAIVLPDGNAFGDILSIASAEIRICPHRPIFQQKLG
ncbi:adenine phosphoribosyltransferase [Striga asiatica]|uniref:adenine phosphoribosyltransferase n=1 Tax=Striga asiatica TaxID=4170 RepID=A0A5A7QU01_STRAF|nr:adenine phosphoribosyltransferase [Striga asiatica]